MNNIDNPLVKNVKIHKHNVGEPLNYKNLVPLFQICNPIMTFQICIGA
jgi:hypothetical protein